MQFSMPDQWSRHLFLALCRRYGMRPYRYYRQRRNTVMVRAPKRFLDQVLWPEFSELDQALQAYLHQVTLRVIREEVYADASEASLVRTSARYGFGSMPCSFAVSISEAIHAQLTAP
jgi:tRNA nucleotidyltransferase (CCA-adding enzyme)